MAEASYTYVYVLNSSYVVTYDASQTGGATVADVSNGPTDNLTELGDIANDTFAETTSTGQYDFTYVGQGVASTSVDPTQTSGVVATSPYGPQFLLTNVKLPIGTAITLTSGETVLPCYAAGTLIRTPSGDVPVESLLTGDMVVTASGQSRPIVWLGHREVSLRHHPERHRVLPVCIEADAFGPGRPYQPLLVSPCHALCVDVLGEVLIHAGELAVGSLVTQIEAERVTYWHVELDQHDLLVANGLPAESFLDLGNRAWFSGAAGSGDPARDQADRFCRPMVNDGPIVEACRTQLRRRAATLGWTTTDQMDTHLIADGVRIDPVEAGGVLEFRLPHTARTVDLCCHAFVPAWEQGSDTRRLGLALRSLHLSDGASLDRSIALEDPRLDEGTYVVEHEDGQTWRWTAGRTSLLPALWDGATQDVVMRLETDPARRCHRWQAPAATQQQSADIVWLRAG